MNPVTIKAKRRWLMNMIHAHREMSPTAGIRRKWYQTSDCVQAKAAPGPPASLGLAVWLSDRPGDLPTKKNEHPEARVCSVPKMFHFRIVLLRKEERKMYVLASQQLFFHVVNGV